MQFQKLRCFQHVNWRPDAAELRKFAIAMVIGFSVIGFLFGLKAHNVAGVVPRWALIGALLAVIAMIPGAGRYAYLAVYLPTSAIGFVISHVLLTVVYFVVFTPMGLLLRLFGRDLLGVRRPLNGSTWRARGGKKDSRSYYRQY